MPVSLRCAEGPEGMTGWRNISGEISVSVFGRLVFWLALTQLSFRFLWFGLVATVWLATVWLAIGDRWQDAAWTPFTGVTRRMS
ncbi:MAG: hypothetical protein GY819_05480 [Planctomycetaceae bacterium]|nr:hypothetical protein [Planctomycetaceae bacterium]